MLMIKDAQLLLNNHRVAQGLMDFYQGSIQERIHALSKPFEGEDPMMQVFRGSLASNFKKSLTLHQKAALLLEQGFKGSTKSRKHLKAIGLHIPLKDYLTVLNNQSKLYKDFWENFTQMQELSLYGMLIHCSVKEQPEISRSIYELLESVKDFVIFIKNLCDSLKMIEDHCVHVLQEASTDVVSALNILNSVHEQQARLQAQDQKERGSAPYAV